MRFRHSQILRSHPFVKATSPPSRLSHPPSSRSTFVLRLLDRFDCARNSQHCYSRSRSSSTRTRTYCSRFRRLSRSYYDASQTCLRHDLRVLRYRNQRTSSSSRDLFFDDTVDEKVCDWPERSQEEFAEENVGTEERQEKWNEPYWYDLLMRLGRMGRDTNEPEAESENVSEEGSDEEE